MIEVTREHWTPAAYKIAEHVKALEEIMLKLKIDTLNVGISGLSDGNSFAFCLIRNEEGETVKSFEVQVFKDQIIFKEDNNAYKKYKRT